MNQLFDAIIKMKKLLVSDKKICICIDIVEFEVTEILLYHWHSILLWKCCSFNKYFLSIHSTPSLRPDVTVLARIACETCYFSSLPPSEIYNKTEVILELFQRKAIRKDSFIFSGNLAGQMPLGSLHDWVKELECI